MIAVLRALTIAWGVGMLASPIQSVAAAEEQIYSFERLQPVLQQPWYFQQPEALLVLESGFVLVADSYNHRLVKLNRDGHLVTWENLPPGETIHGLARIEDTIYAVGRTQLFILDKDLNVTDTWAIPEFGETDNGVQLLSDLVADEQNEVLYYLDRTRGQILQISTSGEIQLLAAASALKDSRQFAFDGQSLYVIDFDAGLLTFDLDGSLVSADDRFAGFWGIAVHGSTLLVSSRTSLQKITKDGDVLESRSFDFETAVTGNIIVDDGSRIYMTMQRGVIGTGFNDADRIWASTQPNGLWRPTEIKSDNAGRPVISTSLSTGTYSASVVTLDPQTLRPVSHVPVPGATVTTFAPGPDGSVFAVPDVFGPIPVLHLGEDASEIARWDNQDDLTLNRIEYLDEHGVIVCATNRDASPTQVSLIHLSPSLAFEWEYQVPHQGEDDWCYDTEVVGDAELMIATNHGLFEFDLIGRTLASVDATFTARTPFHAFSSQRWLRVAETAPGINGELQLFENGALETRWINPYGIGTAQAFDNVDVTVIGDFAYIASQNNSTVQKARLSSVSSGQRAIVVAGGGPYPGNDLWNSTQLAANFAYRTLAFQGFRKADIYYLSNDIDLDLDQNGEFDDVDAVATNVALEQAITDWATSAQDVVIYLVNHGGENTFRMSGTEILSSAELAAWIDDLQRRIPGKVTVVYDACDSGSFQNALVPDDGMERTIVTSTSPGENAVFIGQGSISFSNYFWTHVFNGLSVGQAFQLASEALGNTVEHQHPLVDANGNGEANEASDFDVLGSAFLGNGTDLESDAPTIASVSMAQTISGNNATITASGVNDEDGVARVWAVVRPPDYRQGSPGNATQELPEFELLAVGDGSYTGSSSIFSASGTWQIAIYAKDAIGNTSVPELTTVVVDSPLSRKAVLVVAGTDADSDWPFYESSGQVAYDALRQQGYSDENIFYMSDSGTAGVDVSASLANVDHALREWAAEASSDVVLYIVGASAANGVRLNNFDVLTPAALQSHLLALEDALDGVISVVLDVDRGGRYVDVLLPAAGNRRIVIASVDTGFARFFSNGELSFSRFFWRKIFNGSSLRESFRYADRAMRFSADSSGGLLNDDGSTEPNQKSDGLLSRSFRLGSGILLAGDDPLVGSISESQSLDGEVEATVRIGDIATTGQIASVSAIVTWPNGVIHTYSGDAEGDDYVVELTGLVVEGDYDVAVYVTDQEGNTSLPVYTTITQTQGSDAYEPDDSLADASTLIVNADQAQLHRFDVPGDIDVARFAARGGDVLDVFEIELRLIDGLASDADPVLEVLDIDGNVLHTIDDGIVGEDELFSFRPLADGLYYLRVSNFEDTSGPSTAYELKVFQPIAAFAGPDIAANVSVPGIELAVGAIATMTMQIENRGGQGEVQTATSVVNRIYVPRGINLETLPDNCAPQNDEVVNCELGDIEAGATVTLELPLQVTRTGRYRIVSNSVGFEANGRMQPDERFDNNLAELQLLVSERDSDGDGEADSVDEDDDNDGVADSDDAFPLDASESNDFDADGIGDNADLDDDNDGVNDDVDAFPRDAGESEDTDGDGVGNNADDDDDGDGVADAEDAFPLDDQETSDADGDGVGDNADPDDNNDGIDDDLPIFSIEEDTREFDQFEERVLGAYLAYFGRPGDLGGLDYWSGQLEAAGGDLEDIIFAFGNADEFDRRFGGLSALELIENLYVQILGREPDAGGRDYWLGEFESGRRSLQAISLSILDGVQGDDVDTVANRLAFSKLYISLREENRITPLSDEQLASLVAEIDERRATLVDVVLTLSTFST